MYYYFYRQFTLRARKREFKWTARVFFFFMIFNKNTITNLFVIRESVHSACKISISKSNIFSSDTLPKCLFNDFSREQIHA